MQGRDHRISGWRRLVGAGKTTGRGRRAGQRCFGWLGGTRDHRGVFRRSSTHRAASRSSQVSTRFRGGSTVVSIEEEFSGYQPDDSSFRRAPEDRQGARSAPNRSRRVFVHTCRSIFRRIDPTRIADVLSFARIECVSGIQRECAGVSQ